MGKGKKASSNFIPPSTRKNNNSIKNKIETEDNSSTCSSDENISPLSSNSHSKSPFNRRGIDPEILRKPSLTIENINDLEVLPEVPLFDLITTYLSYAILVMVGQVRDFFGRIFKSHEYKTLNHIDGYAPLIGGFESLYHRRIFRRGQDCFHRPVTGVPGRKITLIDRTSKDNNKTLQFTGNNTSVLNLSSYNYLGFAQSSGPCIDDVIKSVNELGITTSGPRNYTGNYELLSKAESLVARFVGKEDSIIISQGFSTNSTTLPALVSKGGLIISDELNHSSLIFGARLSGSNIRVFKHNDVKDLERLLREVISQGQPRTHRPWNKILLVIEGLYSMEGTVPMLPEIINLKNKYKFYIYLDEAHSIGAMGPRGRGICDYFGVDPANIDILMGTFTKSFGSAGGYISGDKELIDRLRITNHSSIYAETISVPVVQQVISSMRTIMGEDNTDDGQRRLEALAFNSRYFSSQLRKLGFIVYGSPDSPVIPVLLFHPAKTVAFSRECLKRGIAVVSVSYPATPILTARVRFCLSASHTKADLDWVLTQVSEIGDRMLLKSQR